MARHKFDLSSLPPRPTLEHEWELWSQGLKLAAGVDEAGRGALAGPVAAGAVILLADSQGLSDHLHGVRDSKVMKPADRETWAEIIKETAVAWGVGFSSADEIDRIGIAPATCLAISRAVSQLCVVPDHLLVDYLKLPNQDIPQTSLVKGDARSLSIAAASILAKTSRDALLIEMDQQFPPYGFANHKGYGTHGHRQAIQKFGPCIQHRQSFAPVVAYHSLFPPNRSEN